TTIMIERSEERKHKILHTKKKRNGVRPSGQRPACDLGVDQRQNRDGICWRRQKRRRPGGKTSESFDRKSFRPIFQLELIAKGRRVLQLRLGRRSLGPNGVPRLPARHQGNSRLEGSYPLPGH